MSTQPRGDQELRWLREQVDRALADVYRHESTAGAAACLGLVCASLPALLFLAAVVLHLM